MQAYVTTPGQQNIVLQGVVTERRPDGLYAAPLLPQLFYGADGTQLTTWRQNLSGTGNQTILSRSGGQPSIPKEELYWKKVSGPVQPAAAQPVTLVQPWAEGLITVGLAFLAGLGIIYAYSKIKGER